MMKPSEIADFFFQQPRRTMRLSIAVIALLIMSVMLFADHNEARAQSNVTWTATLSAQQDTGDEYGYEEGVMGSMTDDTFDYGGRTYTIDYIKWDDSAEEVEFRMLECLKGSEFVSLRIGSRTFSSVDRSRYSDAQCEAGRTRNQEFEFDTSSNPLRDGQSYTITLTLRGSGGVTTTPTATATLSSPAAPTGLLRIGSDQMSVKLAWDSVPGVSKYAVQYKRDGANSWISASDNIPGTAYKISSLMCGTDYDFAVKSFGDGTNALAQWSSPSGTLNAATYRCPATASLSRDPSTVTIRNVGTEWHHFTVYSSEDVVVVANPGSVTPRVVTWVGNPQVDYCGFLGNEEEKARSNGQPIYIAGCVAGPATVELRKASDDRVLRTYTFTISGTATLPAPAAPTGLMETTIDDSISVDIDYSTSISVSWSSVNGAARYAVDYKLRTATRWTTASENVSSSSYTIGGLACGNAYDIQVRAYGDGRNTLADWSDPSGTLPASTSPCTQTPISTPTPPTGLTTTAITRDTIRIDWSAVSGAARYAVDYKLRTATLWTTASENVRGSSYTIGGLACGNAYDIRVRAYGDGTNALADWSDPSDTLPESTSPCTVLTASLSPDPIRLLQFHNDPSNWHEFTVSANVPVNVVVNPTGSANALQTSLQNTAPAQCPGQATTSTPRSDGQTIFIASCTTTNDQAPAMIQLVDSSDSNRVITYYSFQVTERVADGCEVQDLGRVSGLETESDDWDTDCRRHSVNVPSGIKAGTYSRYHKFEVRQRSVVQITLDSRYRTFPRLYLMQGDTNESSSFAIGSPIDSDKSRIVRELDRGIYTIESSAETRRDFTLNVKVSDCAMDGLDPVLDNGTKSENVDYNGRWTGTCLSSSSERLGKLASFHNFTLERSAVVRIDITGDDREPNLWLLRGSGISNSVTEADYSVSNDDAAYRVYDALSPGDYTIEAVANSGEHFGNFRLSIEALALNAQTTTGIERTLWGTHNVPTGEIFRTRAWQSFQRHSPTGVELGINSLYAEAEQGCLSWHRTFAISGTPDAYPSTPPVSQFTRISPSLCSEVEGMWFYNTLSGAGRFKHGPEQPRRSTVAHMYVAIGSDADVAAGNQTNVGWEIFFDSDPDIEIASGCNQRCTQESLP